MSDIGKDRLGAAGDEVYAALMAAHDGLTLEESARLNARLVLLLANEVGDLARIRRALEAARGDGWRATMGERPQARRP